MSSLDTTMKIYINAVGREELFKELYESENDPAFFKYLWSPANLERYCLGRTGSNDYAYSHIRALLKKEYKEWKQQKTTVNP